MVFHVRITFKESNEDGELSVAGIGDTVLVEAEEVVNLTQKIPSKVSAIMYTLDDDEEEEEVQKATPVQKIQSTRDEAQIISGARTRGQRTAENNSA